MTPSVGIAELKAHLSEYVRAAQKGKEFIVKDRHTPVAKLTPVSSGLASAHSASAGRPALPVTPATRSMAEVERMLDRARYKSAVPDAAVDRAIQENKQDVYDQWLPGERT
jgi:prevent-host-death family protein